MSGVVRPVRRLVGTYAAWFAVLAIALLTFPPGQPVVIVAAGLTGAAAISYGVRRHRPARRWPWYWLAAALVLGTAGQVISRLLPGPVGTYQPGSPILYGVLLALSVAMVGGIMGLARRSPRDLTAVVDVVILLLGTGLLVGVLVAVPYALTPDLPGIQAVARIFFVGRDVVLLAAVVHLSTSERWSASMGLIVSGVAGFLAYDAVLRLGQIHGVSLQGSGIELGWLLFPAAWGMAALLPTMRHLGEPGIASQRPVLLRLILLGAAATLPVALLMLATYRPTPSWYEPLVATISAIMLALVLAQLLAAAVRLRNQAAGEQALSRAVADVAAANDVDTVTAALEAGVPPLGIGRATTGLRAAVDYQDPAPPAVPVRGAIADSGDLPAAIADRLGGGPVVVYPLCEDGGGLLVLYVRGTDAALRQLSPRLDVLVTQACLVLQRIRLSRELIRKTTEEYVNALAQATGDAIVLVDESDRITMASSSAPATFGTSELIGAKLPELIDPAARSAIVDLLRRGRARESVTGQPSADRLGRSRETVAPPSSVTVEAPGAADTASWRQRRSDGTEAHMEVACRRVTSTEPSVRGLLVDLRDVTEQRRLEQELTARASRDPLTGLASGLVVRERVRKELEADHDGLVGMIMLDIDEFKLINAQRGMDVGDRVLQAVASRLVAALPPSGVAGRVAGDRFAVVVDVATPAEADEIAHRLLDAIAQPIEVAPAAITCTATAGVATTADADTPQELARQAELAFLLARDEGRGRWHHYDPTARSVVLEKLEMRAALEHALDEHELALEYQPIIDLEIGAVAGFEALLRWRHPTYGQLAPGAFIDVAEESKLIIPIGDWALATAIQDARRWDAVAPDRAPFVAVNVSSTQFAAPGFLDRVQRLLVDTRFPAARLHLEITESALLSDDAVWAELQRLRDLGIQIAIDDFGTGYSALSYLGRVPAERIKLDPQFVASMTANRAQRDLVEGIVKLTRILKLEVIAEGVETEQERDLVVEVGCRFGQGYLFARPMSADATVDWLVAERQRRAVAAGTGPGGG